MNQMSEEDRLKASIEQIYTYGGSQYTKWRVVAVKSIKKILLSLNEFYADLLPELEKGNEQEDIVSLQIRNGWFYEAVSQTEQAIEDLFSTLMNTVDIAYFAKNVVNYKAHKVKKYIWDFDVDNLEYISKQFHIPYFPLNEPWPNQDVFEVYKTGMLLIQQYLKELQTYHMKYYTDYCQYKHGMSVGLKPMQNPLLKGDNERREKIMENPLQGGLYTFHNENVGIYQQKTGVLPAMGMILKPDMQHCVSALHNEDNLLYFTIHVADIDEMVQVTEHACILLDIVWANIIKRCEEKETDEYSEVAFPLNHLGEYVLIWFPKGEENE